MSGPGVGFEYPSVPTAWLKRDALLFAASIGATDQELHFLYVRVLDRPRAIYYELSLRNFSPGTGPQLLRFPHLLSDLA